MNVPTIVMSPAAQPLQTYFSMSSVILVFGRPSNSKRCQGGAYPSVRVYRWGVFCSCYKMYQYVPLAHESETKRDEKFIYCDVLSCASSFSFCVSGASIVLVRSIVRRLLCRIARGVGLTPVRCSFLAKTIFFLFFFFFFFGFKKTKHFNSFYYFLRFC